MGRSIVISISMNAAPTATGERRMSGPPATMKMPLEPMLAVLNHVPRRLSSSWPIM